MSRDQKMSPQVHRLFDQLIQDSAIEHISQLGNQLPSDPSALRYLAARCLEQSLRSMRAERHTEGRRLGILGRQLQEWISD
jgi:hypothetical protein